jgi:hypothetical protein
MSTTLTATINDKIMPEDRGDIYELPLGEYLKSKQYGTVEGGGTKVQKSGEISYCVLDIVLSADTVSKEVIADIIAKLESFGAPKGSHITFEKTEEKIVFGKLEGLGLYLDGINLPEQVYRESDSNVVLKEINKLSESPQKIDRFWQGDTETAFYVYGESFEKMKDSISQFVATYPLCQGAKIVQIA